MGLAVRIIPTLLKRGDQLVKGQRFNAWRTVGLVEQAAAICGSRSVDEIILLDIDATPSGKGPDFDFIERVAPNFFTPLTIGGGINSVEHVARALRAGADKVAIGTGACDTGSTQKSGFVADCSSRFGSQAIVVSIDVKGGNLVWVRGATSMWVDSQQEFIPWNPVSWAVKCAAQGAGEILLTSVDREGTMEGYDLELIRAVSEAVDIPVIAHGGCSGYPDMLAAIQAGASAVAAGALFQFTNHTPRGAAEWLAKHGVETRIPC